MKEKDSSKVLRIRIGEVEKEALDIVCAIERSTISEVISRALEYYIISHLVLCYYRNGLVKDFIDDFVFASNGGDED